MLSECDGHVRELAIQYETSAKEISLPVYRQFLPALEPDISVRVVCPNLAAYRELVSSVGPVRCELVPVLVQHAITTWSRDRWVALGPSKGGGTTTLLYPRGEAGAEIWPARAGDERVARELALACPAHVAARRSSLFFDGGDFLADGENVFVMPRVVQRNLQHTVANRETLVKELARQLGRRVILLNNAPDHHAGMFMASVGHRTMLVGDPSMATALLGTEPSLVAAGFVPDADFSQQTQGLFDAVAVQCAAAGYRVIRIPTVLGTDGRTYVTYVNALLDQQWGCRTVYMPVYGNAEKLNEAARKIWEEAGFVVRPIDCTSAYRHFGCLHCLVNVVKRREAVATAEPTGFIPTRLPGSER